MDAAYTAALEAVLVSLLTAFFGYIVYRFSSKSRCSVCREYLPASDLRWTLFVTNPKTEKLEEKACCNPCFQAWLIGGKAEACVRCGASLEVSEGIMFRIGDDAVRVCARCAALPLPSEKVMLKDLLNEEFLSHHTVFSSFSDLISKYGGVLKEEDLNTFEFDAFIRANSDYAFFRDMLEDAKEWHRVKLLRRHFYVRKS
ncbi:hypothetical protein [Thalassolituus sp. UBA2009]|uniref:hypothetical protein n=1 Tax=Thalassolituus sp. UBA2009 TaxID=1947658 RepID=UPI000C42CADA|nr:hypothetical protein [Thalassolituus sp. UBA2009]MAY16072.1 hypothetical protein [Oceanospirillaceae bacterium]